MTSLKQFIRDVPDFPKPGIIFKDITPLLSNAGAFRETILALKEPFDSSGITKIVGIESRGFIFGASLALAMNVGFVPVRKKGKLPWETFSQSYEL